MKLFFYLLVILLFQCSANLMNRDILVLPEEKKNASALDAVILKIDFRNTNSENIDLNSYAIFKKSLLASIHNSQKFHDVKLANERTKRNSENTVYIDLIIQPTESGEYGKLHNSSFNFWWLMWPSIYPMTLYFPIQVKSGIADVRIRANIEYKDLKKTILIEKSEKYNIFVYAYFITYSIETALQKSYEESLKELTSKVSEIEFMQIITLDPALEKIQKPSRFKK